MTAQEASAAPAVRLRSLYICYLSLGDPLVRTQVIAYLQGLAKLGHEIHLLTFEPRRSRADRRRIGRELAEGGIRWRSLRYHKQPSLLATIYDVLVGAALAARTVRRYRIDAVHARSHVPAAMALLVRRVTRCGLIFDIRGLWAEEYADAGRWRRGGLAYRITDRVQRAAIERADAIVVLTERVRRHLFGPAPPHNTHVIPCCADLNRVAATNGAPASVRERLDLADRPVLLYVGKLTPPYMDREMVEFYVAARRIRPELAFMVVTQADPVTILRELERADISDRDYRVTSAEPGAIGDYLATAAFAICFCRPRLSLIAASPTKVGEYLAAGLPVVSGPRMGDVDALVAGEKVGVVVNEFSDEEYGRAAERVLELLAAPDVADRCRRVGRAHFSLSDVGIPRYDAVYRQVAQAREATP